MKGYSDLKRRYYQEKGGDIVDMIEHLFEEFDLQSFLDNFVSIISELDSVSNTIRRKQKKVNQK